MGHNPGDVCVRETVLKEPCDIACPSGQQLMWCVPEQV